MKRETKPITLKEDTLNDITNNNIDVNQFIKRINMYLKKANYLLNNKIDNMDELELYNSLKEIYNFYFDQKDYLKILSLRNNKHYSNILNIKTNIYDKFDNNLNLLCIATNKVNCSNNSTLDIKSLRKLTNSEDLLVLKEIYKKENEPIKRREKYESFIYEDIDINNPIIDEDNNLFPYALELIRKELETKYIILDIKQYVDEVIHQTREITGLSLIKNDNVLANIGKQYKRAYDNAREKNIIPKKEKVDRRYRPKIQKNRRR